MHKLTTIYSEFGCNCLETLAAQLLVKSSLKYSLLYFCSTLSCLLLARASSSVCGPIHDVVVDVVGTRFFFRLWAYPCLAVYVVGTRFFFRLGAYPCLAVYVVGTRFFFRLRAYPCLAVYVVGTRFFFRLGAYPCLAVYVVGTRFFFRLRAY